VQFWGLHIYALPYGIQLFPPTLGGMQESLKHVVGQSGYCNLVCDIHHTLILTWYDALTLPCPWAACYSSPFHLECTH